MHAHIRIRTKVNGLATTGQEIQNSLESESTEFDGGEAVVDLFQSMGAAVKDFFTLSPEDDDPSDLPHPNHKAA